MVPFFPNFILKYQFRNDEKVKNVTCPVTVFHGTADEVLPYEASLKLKDIRPDLIEFFTLKGVSHRQTIFNHIVRNKIGELLN